MQKAFALEKADRVPLMCQLAIGHLFLHSGFDPVRIWFDTETMADAFVGMQRRYGFDGILLNLAGREPNWEGRIDRIEEKSDGEKWVWWKNGNCTKVPPDDNPHYFQADHTRYFPTFEEVDPEKLWYVDPWDATEMTYPYTWGFENEARPFENYFPEHHFDLIRRVRERVGDSVAVHGEVFSPFSQFLEFFNYENAFLAMMDDPGKCHAILERFAQGTVDYAERQVREGVDAVLISSAFAGGGMISRDDYSAFVLPYEKRVIEEVQSRTGGIPFYTHTCGSIGDRLDLMLQTRTNGVDTLDPPPLGTVELEEAVKLLRGRAFIKGNLDPVNELLRGDRTVLKEAVLKRLGTAASDGGYILSTACSVAPPTPPENIEYLAELVTLHGSYD